MDPKKLVDAVQGASAQTLIAFAVTGAAVAWIPSSALSRLGLGTDSQRLGFFVAVGCCLTLLLRIATWLIRRLRHASSVDGPVLRPEAFVRQLGPEELLVIARFVVEESESIGIRPGWGSLHVAALAEKGVIERGWHVDSYSGTEEWRLTARGRQLCLSADVRQYLKHTLGDLYSELDQRVRHPR